MFNLLLATVSWLVRVKNVKFTPSQQQFTDSEIHDYTTEMYRSSVGPTLLQGRPDASDKATTTDRRRAEVHS